MDSFREVMQSVNSFAACFFDTVSRWSLAKFEAREEVICESIQFIGEVLCNASSLFCRTGHQLFCGHFQKGAGITPEGLEDARLLGRTLAVSSGSDMEEVQRAI